MLLSTKCTVSALLAYLSFLTTLVATDFAQPTSTIAKSNEIAFSRKWKAPSESPRTFSLALISNGICELVPVV